MFTVHSLETHQLISGFWSYSSNNSALEPWNLVTSIEAAFISPYKVSNYLLRKFIA
jgi:hypothetical protein